MISSVPKRWSFVLAGVFCLLYVAFDIITNLDSYLMYFDLDSIILLIYTLSFGAVGIVLFFRKNTIALPILLTLPLLCSFYWLLQPFFSYGLSGFSPLTTTSDFLLVASLLLMALLSLLIRFGAASRFCRSFWFLPAALFLISELLWCVFLTKLYRSLDESLVSFVIVTFALRTILNLTAIVFICFSMSRFAASGSHRAAAQPAVTAYASHLSQASVSPRIEELRTYKQLLDEGLITAQDYEEKKRQLLR